jgi:hypothetical protein
VLEIFNLLFPYKQGLLTQACAMHERGNMVKLIN